MGIEFRQRCLRNGQVGLCRFVIIDSMSSGRAINFTVSQYRSSKKYLVRFGKFISAKDKFSCGHGNFLLSWELGAIARAQIKFVSTDTNHRIDGCHRLFLVDDKLFLSSGSRCKSLETSNKGRAASPLCAARLLPMRT